MLRIVEDTRNFHRTAHNTNLGLKHTRVTLTFKGNSKPYLKNGGSLPHILSRMQGIRLEGESIVRLRGWRCIYGRAQWRSRCVSGRWKAWSTTKVFRCHGAHRAHAEPTQIRLRYNVGLAIHPSFVRLASSLHNSIRKTAAIVTKWCN